jgi:filamentous hemagglutinin family protein
MVKLKLQTSLALLASSASVWANPMAQVGPAQSIVPAPDGTATLVTIDGQEFRIEGGSLSADGGNLFHSFAQFGLTSQEMATFLANPQLQNILSRVTGGNLSHIDGLMQVTGGSPNLFLMNPAGIVFGANAQLNLPADFTATTATGIGFDGVWFNAFGPNDYLDLVGTPTELQFGTTEASVIVNAGNLGVESGHHLALVGGSVVNTGTLSAPEGQITIAAIPGTHRVRIGQGGSLLRLELELDQDPANQVPSGFRGLDLPSLLTLGIGAQTGLVLAADGTVQVADQTIPTEPGVAIVTGTVDASGVDGSESSTGATIAVLGNTVELVDADMRVANQGNVNLHRPRMTLPSETRLV